MIMMMNMIHLALSTTTCPRNCVLGSPTVFSCRKVFNMVFDRCGMMVLVISRTTRAASKYRYLLSNVFSSLAFERERPLQVTEYIG